MPAIVFICDTRPLKGFYDNTRIKQKGDLKLSTVRTSYNV